MILINSILISALFRLLMEQAIHEALLTAPGRAVGFGSGISQLEILPKFLTQGLRAVAYNLQPATLLRAVLGKGSNDQVHARLESGLHRMDVALAVGWVGQEMEDRPVVPQVEGCQRKADLGDIALDPLDLSDTSSETLPGALQSHGGDVQHRRPDKAQREQIIYQGGITPTDVDQARLEAD